MKMNDGQARELLCRNMDSGYLGTVISVAGEGCERTTRHISTTGGAFNALPAAVYAPCLIQSMLAAAAGYRLTGALISYGRTPYSPRSDSLLWARSNGPSPARRIQFTGLRFSMQRREAA